MTTFIETPVPPAPDGTYAHNPTMAAEGVALLVEFFRKPRNTEFLRVVLGQVQELEDVYNQLLGAWDLNTATGDQLDKIGAWVGQGRGDSADDEEYRTSIRVRILINQSRGTLPELIEIMEIAVPATAAFGSGFQELYPATLIATWDHSDITVEEALEALNLLRDAKPAGVSMQVIYTYFSSFLWTPTGNAGFPSFNGYGTVDGYPSEGTAGRLAAVLP